AVRYPDGTVRHHGAVPASGATVSVTGYRTGGGVVGNVGAGTLAVLRTTIPYIDRVTNLERASGGVDGETVANAKLRGPLALRTGDRAVTAADVERLALDADPAVARARCLAPSPPGGPVRLFIVPRVEKPAPALELDDFAVDDRLFGQIRSHLEPRRVLGTTIQIGTPYYQGVSAAVLVHATAGRSVDLVRERALEALYHWINPVTGGPGGAGWPFDVHLSAGATAEMLAALDGIDSVEEVLLFEVDVRNRNRVGAGKELIQLTPESLFLSHQHRVVVKLVPPSRPPGGRRPPPRSSGPWTGADGSSTSCPCASPVTTSCAASSSSSRSWPTACGNGSTASTTPSTPPSPRRPSCGGWASGSACGASTRRCRPSASGSSSSVSGPCWSAGGRRRACGGRWSS